MKTVLITGAAGNLGRNLVKFCADLPQYSVMAISNQKEKIPKGDNIQGLTNEELFQNSSLNIDTVINCAFARGNQSKNLVSALFFNERLIEYLKKIQVGSIINISSQGLYKSQHPGVFVDEYGEIEPSDMYALSKFAQERLFTSNFGRAVTNIRLASLSSNARFLGFFVDSVINGRDIVITAPNQYVSLIDVRDAVAAIIEVMEISASSRAAIYNLGIGKQYSILEVAESVIEIGTTMGFQSARIHKEDSGKQFAIGMNCSRLMEDTGWKPTISLYEMIKALFTERVG